MDALIWIGTVLSLTGIAGLAIVIVQAARARRAGLGDDALKERLRRLVAWNLAALMVSMLGLMAVILSVILS